MPVSPFIPSPFFQNLNSEGCVTILKLNLAVSFIVCLPEGVVSLSGTVDTFPLW